MSTIMETITKNLQTLSNIKASLKTSLENQNKAPTDTFETYSELIGDLENPEDVTYCVTLDGESKVYAQLHGQEKVTLTATPNDIRINTSAITNEGYTEGEKDIPSYYSSYGRKYVLAGKEAVITSLETDYKSLMVTIAPFNLTAEESVAVNYVSVDDIMYEVGTGTKVSDITKDLDNEEINLGITVTEKSVLRYLVVREEV